MKKRSIELKFDPSAIVKAEYIGKGAFARVYRGYDLVKKRSVAIKIIDLENDYLDVEDIQSEISLLCKCNCPNVVKYYGSMIKDAKLWIVMEYLGGGSVSDLMRAETLTEKQIAIILREVLKALRYLHDEHMIHRDLKCDNILLSSFGDVKLIDFNVATQLSYGRATIVEFVGSPYWMAPEVIGGGEYNEKADIWSLGITAIELSSGEPPLVKITPARALHLIKKYDPPKLMKPFCSNAYKTFVASCLQKIPSERLSAHQLLKLAFIREASDKRILRGLIVRYRIWKIKNSIVCEEPKTENSGENISEVDSWKLTPKIGSMRTCCEADHNDDDSGIDKSDPNETVKIQPQTNLKIDQKLIPQLHSSDKDQPKIEDESKKGKLQAEKINKKDARQDSQKVPKPVTVIPKWETIDIIESKNIDKNLLKKSELTKLDTNAIKNLDALDERNLNISIVGNNLKKSKSSLWPRPKGFCDKLHLTTSVTNLKSISPTADNKTLISSEVKVAATIAGRNRKKAVTVPAAKEKVNTKCKSPQPTKIVNRGFVSSRSIRGSAQTKGEQIETGVKRITPNDKKEQSKMYLTKRTEIVAGAERPKLHSRKELPKRPLVNHKPHPASSQVLISRSNHQLVHETTKKAKSVTDLKKCSPKFYQGQPKNPLEHHRKIVEDFRYQKFMPSRLNGAEGPKLHSRNELPQKPLVNDKLHPASGQVFISRSNHQLAPETTKKAKSVTDLKKCSPKFYQGQPKNPLEHQTTTNEDFRYQKFMPARLNREPQRNLEPTQIDRGAPGMRNISRNVTDDRNHHYNQGFMSARLNREPQRNFEPTQMNTGAVSMTNISGNVTDDRDHHYNQGYMYARLNREPQRYLEPTQIDRGAPGMRNISRNVTDDRNHHYNQGFMSARFNREPQRYFEPTQMDRRAAVSMTNISGNLTDDRDHHYNQGYMYARLNREPQRYLEPTQIDRDAVGMRNISRNVTDDRDHHYNQGYMSAHLNREPQRYLEPTQMDRRAAVSMTEISRNVTADREYRFTTYNQGFMPERLSREPQKNLEPTQMYRRAASIGRISRNVMNDREYHLSTYNQGFMPARSNREPQGNFEPAQIDRGAVGMRNISRNVTDDIDHQGYMSALLNREPQRNRESTQMVGRAVSMTNISRNITDEREHRFTTHNERLIPAPLNREPQRNLEPAHMDRDAVGIRQPSRNDNKDLYRQPQKTTAQQKKEYNAAGVRITRQNTFNELPKEQLTKQPAKEQLEKIPRRNMPSYVNMEYQKNPQWNRTYKTEPSSKKITPRTDNGQVKKPVVNQLPINHDDEISSRVPKIFQHTAKPLPIGKNNEFPRQQLQSNKVLPNSHRRGFGKKQPANEATKTEKQNHTPSFINGHEKFESKTYVVQGNKHNYKRLPLAMSLFKKQKSNDSSIKVGHKLRELSRCSRVAFKPPLRSKK